MSSNVKLKESKSNNVVSFFRQAADKYVNKTAVQCKSESISYKELDQKSDKLAYAITKQSNANSEHNIILLFEQGIDMTVGMLGALKSGNAYIPLDPEHPVERLKYIIEDSDAVLIISNYLNKNIIEKLLNQKIKIIFLEELEGNAEVKFDITIDAQQRSVILYTSGSTGEPKGVEHTHFSLFHNIYNYYTTIKMTEHDRVALFTSYSHAVAVIDILSTLITGGIVIVYNVKEINSIVRMADWLNSEKITIYHSVPTLYRTFLRNVNKPGYFNSVRLVILGGEAVSKDDFLLFKKYFTKGSSFINFLGASEILVATLNIISYDEEIENDWIPTGKLVRGLEIYLLDKKNRLVPKGETGEIVYKSAYLAKGYWKRKASTKAHFLIDPVNGDGFIYKSGDLGIFTDDRELKYIGREDTQIKLRGIRIELGEIENQIDRLRGINKSIVVLHKSETEDNFLVAFFEKANEDRTADEIRKELCEKLPMFMIPRYFVFLEQLPLTPNGKIDRKYLENYADFRAEQYNPPENSLQKELCKVWEGIFQKGRVGISDNFFELGGDSLCAVRVITEIFEKLGISISVKDVLLNETVLKLSERINNNKLGMDETKIQDNYFEELHVLDNENKCYPLSNSQKRMYTLYEMEPDSITYNTPVAYLIKGDIDVRKIEMAFQKLVQRHETLRTSFYVLNGEIAQKVNEVNDFKLDYYEIAPDELSKVLEKFVRPFNLEKVPLIRAGIIKLGTDKYVLVYDIHHIVSDGTSAEIIKREISKFYNNDVLPEMRYQFKDFVTWQSNYIISKDYQKQRGFWLNLLHNQLPVLNFPLDYPRPGNQSFRGNSIKAYIDETVTSDLKLIAGMKNSTLFMILLAAYNILLSKYAGQREIVVGTPVAGRGNINLNNMVGMFVNTLVLKNKVQGDMTFQEFLETVRDEALQAYANQDYQFNDLVNELGVKRDSSRNPVFDVMFVMENMDKNDYKLEKAEIENFDLKSTTSKFDMTLIAVEIDNKIELQLEYCTDLFKTETIEGILEHYIILLKQISEKPYTKINKLSMMSNEERNKVLIDFNANITDYPKNKTVAELFEGQVTKTPDNVAVVNNDKALSYRELDQRANYVANLLVEIGVKENLLVGIMADNSIEMIIGIIGILKSGGAYLPVDPEYPNSRIKYMFEDSSTDLVIVQKKYLDKVSFVNKVIVLEDICEHEQVNYQDSNKKSPNNLAYIIYTSGTTGKPKGVMVEQRGIVRLVKNTNYIHINETDRILQTASMVFDATTFEFWAPLLNGACLHISNKDLILNPENLEIYLKKNKITTMWLTSALFNQLCSINSDMFGVLNNLLVGGDILSPKYINMVRDKFKHLNIVNGYGPTENTTFSLCFNIDKRYEDNIPIGKPISNSSAYILGENNALIPIGAIGELCVAGDGLARGYLKRDDLTKEKFVENPFITGTKMYKTGDLARWLQDGNVEFLGRRDSQIKIRGFRIEIGEIESRLHQIHKIKEAVVQAFDDKNKHKYICAYIVSDKEISANEVRQELMQSLPDYMIPTYFVQLDALPVTPNGKIDRNSLPKPEEHIDSNREFEPPQNYIQEVLVKAFSSILDVEIVGINDNFFELGGDSIKAIQVSSFAGGYRIKIETRDIIKYPTIAQVSKLAIVNKIKGQNDTTVSGYLKPTPIQKWFYERKTHDLHHFNNSYMLYRKEGFQVDIIKKVFNAIVNHHDLLRMECHYENGAIIQHLPEVNENSYSIKVVDLKVDSNYVETIENTANKIQSEMNLLQNSLIQLCLFKTSHGDYLAIIIHHIIIDGVSWRILLDDFLIGYKQSMGNEKIKFQEKTTSYTEWSEHLMGYAKSSRITKTIPYWKSVLCEVESIQNRKETSYSNKEYDGKNCSCELSSEETKNLLRCTRSSYDVTINAILLAALGQAYQNCTGNQKMLIDLEGHGREELFPDVNISRTVGWFTTIYPFCLDISNENDIVGKVLHVQKQLEEVPNHGVDYFVLKYLSDKEDTGEMNFNIKPAIGFNYLGQFDKEFKNDLFTISDISCGNNISPMAERMHELEIFGMIIKNRLVFTFNYNKNVYSDNQMELLAHRFKAALLAFIENSKTVVSIQKQVEVNKDSYYIDNINGFNSVFYRDCLYNQTFALIQHYKRDIRCILSDDVFYYTLQKGAIPSLIPAVYSKDDFQKALDKIGLNVETEIECNDIISKIENSIIHGRPVLLLVDCFYLTTRPDMYLKKHWSHVVLIYGFNRGKKEFIIMDHSDVMELDYKEVIIPYDSIKNAYRAYFDTFNNKRNLITYYEFFEKEADENISQEEWKRAYRNNLLLHKDDIFKNLENIIQLKKNIMDLAAEHADIDKIVDDLIDKFMDIIKYKNSEKYAITNLFDNNTKLVEAIDAVIISWDVVRTVFERNKMRSKVNFEVLKNGMDKLTLIYDNEVNYYKTLFSFLKLIN